MRPSVQLHFHLIQKSLLDFLLYNFLISCPLYKITFLFYSFFFQKLLLDFLLYNSDYNSFIYNKRPLDSYACPDESKRNRTTNIFTCKKVFKIDVILRRNTQCVCRVSHFRPKGSNSSSSLHPYNNR